MHSLLTDLLTTAEWEALDEDTYRFAELVDGRLLMAPPPGADHQWAIAHIWHVLNDATPSPSVAYPGIELTIAGDPFPTYRVPDVLVVTAHLPRGTQRVRPEQVILAVEVVSPGSRSQDRLHKKAEYADVGIPFYWVVEVDPFRLVGYRLVDGDYNAYVDTGELPAHVTEPFPVTITLD